MAVNAEQSRHGLFRPEKKDGQRRQGQFEGGVASLRGKRVGHDPAEEAAAGAGAVQDVAGNVRDYVGTNAPPEQRDELLRLAEALLAEEEAR
jgi:hypothetical protein